MNTASILATNLQALINADPDMSEHALSAKSEAPKTSIRRARLNEGAAQIDTVEKVAKAFNLRACDILDPDLTRRLQAGEPLRMGEPKPPVMAEDDWRALSPRARALVEELCETALSGQISDEDITWLHNSLQRITKPQPAPAADKPSIGSMSIENNNGQSGNITNTQPVSFGVSQPRSRKR